MLSSKHISKITVALISVVLVLCVVAIGFSDKLSGAANHVGYTMEYENALFDVSETMDINIVMDESLWNEMLDNAMSETYYRCDVVINGTTFCSVGIRPKGNTSLSSVANDPDNDRYSFKLEFDRFVDGQTCFGLDKLALNNNYADATNMKEAIIYDMFRYLDADAPLYNYAKISVNGEYFGTYLALEAVEDSFMLRNYGTEKGFLYKPDGMNHNNNKDENGERAGFGGGREFSFDEEQVREMMKQRQNRTSSEEQPVSDSKSGGNSQPDTLMPPGSGNGGRQSVGGGFQNGNGPGGGMFGGNGSNLNYTDDSLDSYSAIWQGQVNDSSASDHRRVVEALKNISERNELEKYIDVDSILKYMAVHNFSVNEDSLSGSMAHNYYLYEAGGRISIIPWDYNLALGGMRGGTGSDIINDPIDDSYSSTELFDFVLENPEYLERYHEYYRKLVEEYLFGGKFDETYTRIRGQIDELVKTDPNAMYGYDEYAAGAETFYEAVMLRAESVRGQLDGTIPSTSEGQREDSSELIDASHINISDMGQFMGGGNGGMRGERGGFNQADLPFAGNAKTAEAEAQTADFK